MCAGAFMRGEAWSVMRGVAWRVCGVECVARWGRALRTFGAPGRLIMRHEPVTATTARDRAEYSACKIKPPPLPGHVVLRVVYAVASLCAHRHIHRKQLHKS